MKRLLLLLLLLPALAAGQTGGSGVSWNSASVISLWTGTCDATTFLRADGTCQVASGGGGSGTVTTTGSPANGNLTKFSGATSITNGDLSGDCTTAGALVVACTKTSGVSFATSATTDATNASNIASGTLAVARGGIGVGTLTGVAKGNGTSAFSAAVAADISGLWSGTCNSTTFLRGDGSCQASGTGTVTSVALAAPNWLTVSGSPVTTSGTLMIAGVPAADANSLGLGVGALTQGGITGLRNTAVGQGNVLNAITSGSDNAAVGYQALKALTTGNNNVALGASALAAATTGSQNMAIGFNALGQSTTSGNNTAVGNGALSGITSGAFDNTAIGKNSGTTITSGGGNIVLGEDGNITSGSNNLVIGNTITTTTATSSSQLNIVDSITATNYTTGPITVKGGVVRGGTKFTATGCSISTTVGGATAGKFTSGTTGTCTVVITLGGATGQSAPNGWACHADDLTTPANFIGQSASTTTTCTVQGTTVTGDILVFSAEGF